MPRLPLHPASGISRVNFLGKTIRLVRYGCTNRPFYHIVVIETKKEQRKVPIEQLGTYDPLPNQHNEKLISLNLERIQYWLGHGADVSKPIAQLFGLAGYFPIHPKTYLSAWRHRRNKMASQEAPVEEQSAG